MPVGASGRIVVEIDPELKQELYGALEMDGMRLKHWFLEQVDDFLKNRSQLDLPLFVDDDQQREKEE